MSRAERQPAPPARTPGVSAEQDAARDRLCHGSQAARASLVTPRAPTTASGEEVQEGLRWRGRTARLHFFRLQCGLPAPLSLSCDPKSCAMHGADTCGGAPGPGQGRPARMPQQSAHSRSLVHVTPATCTRGLAQQPARAPLAPV